MASIQKMFSKFYPKDRIDSSVLMLRVGIVFVIIKSKLSILFCAIHLNRVLFGNFSWFRLWLHKLIFRSCPFRTLELHLACSPPNFFEYLLHPLLLLKRHFLIKQTHGLSVYSLFACKAVDNVVKIFVINFKRQLLLLFQLHSFEYFLSQLFFIKLYQNSHQKSAFKGIQQC